MSIVTISRGTMSGGMKIAEMLAERLNYRCIGREIIVKAADDYGVPESKLFDSIQKSPSFLQRFTFERERYLAFIQASLCEFAKDDNIVYHGHAGHFLLKDLSHVLRVRISATMEYRIKVTCDRLGYSPDEAEKYIHVVDKQRSKWTSFLYGVDWLSSELYDLVINLDRGDLELACDIIQYTVNRPSFQSTDDSRKAMDDLLTTSRVRAAIALLPEVRLEHIEVHTKQDGVIISGKVASKEMIDDIATAAQRAPSIGDIENRLDVDYRGYGVE